MEDVTGSGYGNPTPAGRSQRPTAELLLQRMCPGPPVVSIATKRARFLALVAVHTPTLEVVARRHCREPAAAADLVQDTLERAWRRIDSLHAEETRAWLLRVMRNTWIDQLRRRRVEVPMDEAPEPRAAVGAAADDELSWRERVTLDDVRQAIEQLEEPYRSVARLHDLEGHSYRDIAQRLAIPNATAATRLHRAHSRIRALLQRKLGPAEPAGEPHIQSGAPMPRKPRPVASTACTAPVSASRARCSAGSSTITRSDLSPLPSVYQRAKSPASPRR
jgi:RNA polymerase sigma-70 factor, ECF subfamily